MAIIKHISVKNRFYTDAVEYLICKFDEYTNKPILDGKGRIQERDFYLIEGVNCDADTFGAECIETNRLYGKNNAVKDVKAHHYIISFAPTDEITLEQGVYRVSGRTIFRKNVYKFFQLVFEGWSNRDS